MTPATAPTIITRRTETTDATTAVVDDSPFTSSVLPKWRKIVEINQRV